MYQVIIKAKTTTQLRALRKFGIDIQEHNAIQDKNDYLYKVDAIVSDEDINRLKSKDYIVENVSNLTVSAKAGLKEVSRTNKSNEVSILENEKE